MKNTISRLTFMAAAAGLAFAPITAQAKTRAGDNTAVYVASSSQPGLGRDAEGEALTGDGWIVALFAAAALVAGLVIADDDDDQSPGG